jgi:DHA2 family multidrug resistance protein-like MFS transporter
MMATAPLAGLLSERTPTGLMGTIGMGGAVCGVAFMAALPAHPSLLRIIWPLMLCGAGFGCFLSPNSHQIMKAAPHERAASAGGLISTTRLVGSTLGSTLLAFLLSSSLPGGLAACFIAAGFLAMAGLASLCALQAARTARS